jgi:hypothetical protein
MKYSHGTYRFSHQEYHNSRKIALYRLVEVEAFPPHTVPNHPRFFHLKRVGIDLLLLSIRDGDETDVHRCKTTTASGTQFNEPGTAMSMYSSTWASDDLRTCSIRTVQTVLGLFSTFDLSFIRMTVPITTASARSITALSVIITYCVA